MKVSLLKTYLGIFEEIGSSWKSVEEFRYFPGCNNLKEKINKLSTDHDQLVIQTIVIYEFYSTLYFIIINSMVLHSARAMKLRSVRFFSPQLISVLKGPKRGYHVRDREE